MATKTKEVAVVEDSVVVVKRMTQNALKEVESVIVKSDEDLSRATVVLSNVKKLQKFITQEKEKVLKPLREATLAARAIFAPIEEQVDSAENSLKRSMIDYQDKKQAELARKEAMIAKQAEAGRIKPETAIKKMEALPEVKNNVKTEIGTAAFKKVKVVEVTDPTKVPDQYWIIDMTTLRSAALTESKSTGKLGEVIPGVIVKEITSLASTV